MVHHNNYNYHLHYHHSLHSFTLMIVTAMIVTAVMSMQEVRRYLPELSGQQMRKGTEAFPPAARRAAPRCLREYQSGFLPGILVVRLKWARSRKCSRCSAGRPMVIVC